jgi:hypothetical protein
MAGTGERATRLALMQSKNETPCAYGSVEEEEASVLAEEDKEEDLESTMGDEGFARKSAVDFGFRVAKGFVRRDAVTGDRIRSHRNRRNHQRPNMMLLLCEAWYSYFCQSTTHCYAQID